MILIAMITPALMTSRSPARHHGWLIDSHDDSDDDYDDDDDDDDEDVRYRPL